MRAMVQPQPATITIRKLDEADRAEVEALAQRDSALVPQGALLGAVLDGRLLAVTSLADGRTVADPFRRTEEARAMLELRAAQLRRRDGRPGRLRIGQRRKSRATLPASPPGAGGRLLTLHPSRE
jgi:hypothetical protein